jgi:hypothetical protein
MSEARVAVACFNVRALVTWDELKTGDVYHYHASDSEGPNIILIGPKRARTCDILLWLANTQRFTVTKISRNSWAGDKSHETHRLHMV